MSQYAGNKIKQLLPFEEGTNRNHPAKRVNIVSLKLVKESSLLYTTHEANYKVLVGGTEVTVSTEAVSGNTVTLTLATALTATHYSQAITIAPTSDFDVTYGSGNNVTNFTSYTVAK